MLQILITFIYGVIDDLYQKKRTFQNRNYFFSMCCIRLSTICSVHPTHYSRSLCTHTQLQSDINVQEFVLELLEETRMYENNKKVTFIQTKSVTYILQI